MKRIIIALSVLCTFLLPSCSGLWAPQYAENDDILVHVFDCTAEASLGDFSVLYIFNDLSDEQKINKVEMLEWNLNESMQGDSYTGYFVTYKVELKRTWYALVDLTEFDSGRYEWKVIDVDTSLSEIQSMLY